MQAVELVDLLCGSDCEDRVDLSTDLVSPTVVAVVTDPNTARSLFDGLRIPHRSPVFTARGPPDLFDDPSPAFEADPPAPDE